MENQATKLASEITINVETMLAYQQLNCQLVFMSKTAEEQAIKP